MYPRPLPGCSAKKPALSAIPPRPAVAKWDHGLRREALVRSVLTDVFLGRLRAGQHLVAQELADRFGVSQTPIREALITLAGIGVLDLLPNRGAVVRSVTARDVHEVCQVRRVLECEATRAACGRIDTGELLALAADTRELTAAAAGPEYVKRARDLDSHLHDLIAASCENALLAREIGRLKLLFRAYRDVSWERVEAQNDYRRIPVEAREHLAIIDTLIAGDAKAAAKAMAKHIRSGEKYWSRIVPNKVHPTNHQPIAPHPKKGRRR
jgi:DNA-binding GntR family transcriptional regulator